MWKTQVEEESMKVGLRRKDALCRSKCSVGVNKIAAWLNLGESGHLHLLGILPDFKYWCLSLSTVCRHVMFIGFFMSTVLFVRQYIRLQYFFG